MANVKDLLVNGSARVIGTIYGNATSANKLNTNAGSTSQPVYFSNGVPVAITGSLSNNAASATKLLNARNFKIGSTSKSFNGTADVTWTHAEIGATVSNTWAGGTTAGPTLSTTVNGVKGTAVAIPSASTSASGIVTTGAQSFAGIKTFTDPVRIGSDPNGRSKNYIAFYGTTGDNAGNFNHAYIGENLWGSSESSELVLFKGNDIGPDATTIHASGPDRIRHIAGAHLFQTYASALSGTFSDICTSTVPTNIFAINNTNTKHYVDALPATNNTRTLGSASLRWKALLVGTADSYGSATVPVYWNNGVPTAITSYSGNASTATKWQTARNFITNLGSETAASVDGSTGPYNLGVTGTLPVTHGGTGVTSIAEIKAGKDSDGNTIKDTYLKRYRNSNTYGSGYTDLNGTMPPFLQAYKNGYPLHTDPEFASGNNGISLYDNAGSGKTAIERIDMACGNSTGKVLRIRNIGSGPSPYLGGWYFGDITAYARQYVCIFRAKAPVGYTITWHSNSCGTNSKTYWVTDNAGTGKWEWYAYFVDNGSADFSSTMFFALSGTPGTTNAPVDWFLSYANIIILSYGAYDGLRTRYADNADRWTNSRTFITALNSESSASVNGSANVTLGVSGILPISHGGTGQNDLSKVSVGTAASCTGNAATATKLATARTITLTGSVNGSGTFDGSGNLSIATTTNHTHSYLPLSGGTLTGNLTTPSLNTAFLFNNTDIPEGAANLSATTTAHKMSFYRNGITIPYQMDNSNDGGIIRCRGTSESNVIFELGTWDDYGTGETIQFNYYPTTSQVTPTYSVTVPKKSGTIALVGDSDAGFVRKIGDIMTGDLTAPTFHGNLNGNATSANSSLTLSESQLNKTSLTTYLDNNANIHKSSYQGEMNLYRFFASGDEANYATSYGLPAVDNHVLVFSIDGINDWERVIDLDIRSTDIFTRAKTSGTWGAWTKLLNTTNYASTLDSRYVLKSGDTMTGQLNATAGLKWAHAYWNPNCNLYCIPTANNQEWSIDLGNTNYTGSYFHIWSNRNSATILGCYDDNRYVEIPVHLYVGGYNNTSYALSTSSLISQSWIRTTEATGWYNETYGGGLYMTDSNFIRNYNLKALSINVASNNAWGIGGHRLAAVFKGSDHSSILLSTSSLGYGLCVNNDGNWYWGKRTTSSETSTSGDSYILYGNTSHVSPYSTNAIDLGSSANKWRNLYASTLYGTSKDVDVASYRTTAGTENYILIKINNPSYYMTAFTVRAYQSYNLFDVTFSGYQYGTNYWYSPRAALGSDSTVSSLTVYFGYNSTNEMWVALPGLDYTGVKVMNVVNGYQPLDITSAFSITRVSSLPGTIQSTQTIYRPWIRGESVTGAVWNDYAEYREADTIQGGRCVREVGDDTLVLTTKRLMRGCSITSDTWGFAQGETDKAKTPIAVAGRVLAYPLEDRELFRRYIGYSVCSGPDGTVSLMTEEEELKYPWAIVGTVSAVPDYEEWGGGEMADRPSVKVDGRIWIKVK